MKESLPFIVIAILIASLPALGQFKHDYTWAMGYDCCRGDENDNYLLDFTSGKLKIDTATLAEEFHRAGQICDKYGNLALYTKGCKVYNGKNQMLIKGDSLIISDSMNYFCLAYARQGIIILPDGYHENKYWLFYKSAFIRNNPKPGSYTALVDAMRYAIIDMAADSGHGEVVIKNKSIIIDTALVFGDLCAVKHSNNLDWWLITTIDKPDRNYYIIHLRQNEISFRTIKIGNQITTIERDSEGLLFSPDGAKLATYSIIDGLFLFDFDREHGVLSNFKKVDFPNSGSKFGGLAFSPSGRFLYVSTDTILYQYDFWETDSTKAMVEVGWFDGYYERYYTTFYTMQLGPDCRIYMATNPNSRYLHVIKKPDLKGTACEFVQRAVRLPWYNDYYMPYYPNFRLGYAPVCDSTIGFVGDRIVQKDMFSLKLSPNPVAEQLILELELQNTQELTFEIKDLNGQLVFRKQLDQNQTHYILNVKEFLPGMYIYNLSSKKGLLMAGKLVKM